MGKRVTTEIEDVREPFCGSRKKDLIPVCKADPQVASEWCYIKNCGWGPEDFSRGSNVKAYWDCPLCLRTYKASISNRISNQSACPYCASKRVCSDNALSQLYPELIKDWHSTKNGALKPDQVTKFSTKRVWWLCSNCSFEWETVVADRTSREAGCPACYRAQREYQKTNYVKAERKPIIIGKTDVPRKWYESGGKEYQTLAEAHPKIAREWHPQKNDHWTSSDFSHASGVKVWWKCNKGPDHEWQATISHRTKRNHGCPFCSGHRVSKTSSLEALFPKVAKQWHPTKNGKLKPSEVKPGSDKKAFWMCLKDKEHQWEASVGQRTTGTGCPFCSGAKPRKNYCLLSEFPYIAAELHPTKNDGLKGTDLTPKSSKKVFWLCKKDKTHEWRATPVDRVLKGSGCPICAGKVATNSTSLAALHPKLAKEWDTTRNGSLRPEQVLPGSNKAVYWKCRKGHSWQQVIRQRTKNETACYECKTGKPKRSSDT